MSIKPVGKIYLVTDYPECEWYQPVSEGDLLYAIPDTHRVVSVELLRHITGSNETSEFVNAHIEIRAIIEDKPCSQS